MVNFFPVPQPSRSRQMRRSVFGGVPGGGAAAAVPGIADANLQAWYVADEQPETAGSTVSTMVDQSGNGFDATSVSVACTVENGLNGLKKFSIPFNGRFETSGTLMTGATEGCFYAIMKRGAGGTDPGPPLGYFDSELNVGNHVPFSDGNTYEGFGSTARKSCGNIGNHQSDELYSVHSATNDFRVYINGVLRFSTTTNTVNFGSGTRRFFGDTANNGTSYFKWFGDCSEIIITDVFQTDTDREMVEGYLHHKYGLQSLLPSGHPYKSSPP